MVLFILFIHFLGVLHCFKLYCFKLSELVFSSVIFLHPFMVYKDGIFNGMDVLSVKKEATLSFIRFYKKRKRGFVGHPIALPAIQRPYPLEGVAIETGVPTRPQNVSAMVCKDSISNVMDKGFYSCFKIFIRESN